MMEGLKISGGGVKLAVMEGLKISGGGVKLAVMEGLKRRWLKVMMEGLKN